MILCIEFFGLRMVNNIDELMSGILFNQLFSCILFLALMLFSMDQSETFDSSLLSTHWMSLQSLISFLIIGYVYCRLSENITTKSFEIGDTVYSNSFWYEMSINERKSIIPIIRQSQREFRLKGLGIIDGSLATYLTVILISNFNYFLISVDD